MKNTLHGGIQALRWNGFLVSVICLGLTGCQSSDPGDVLKLKGGADQHGGQVRDPETFGAGPIRIAYLLPLSAGGIGSVTGRDIRNGAVLALKELDAGKLTLTVYDTAGTSDRAQSISKQATSAGAKLLVISGGLNEIQSLDRKDTISVVFAPSAATRPSGMFAFETDDTDSLLKGIEYAASTGRKKIVLLAPVDFETERLRWINAKLDSAAQAIIVTYAKSESPAKIVKRAEAQLSGAGIIAFAGRESTVAQIAKALHVRKLSASNAMIVGHEGWSESLLRFRELDGAIVAKPKISDFSSVSARYQAEFGQSMTINAAYGYDITATAAGIGRVLGEGGFTRKTLLSKSGFRGATGIFKFVTDGSIDRLFSFYIVKGGKLKLVDAAPDGF